MLDVGSDTRSEIATDAAVDSVGTQATEKDTVPPLCETDDSLEVIPSRSIYGQTTIFVALYAGRWCGDMVPSDLEDVVVVVSHAELSNVAD